MKKISINSDEFVELLASLNIDIAVTVFWGEIIKEKVLNLAKLGFF